MLDVLWEVASAAELPWDVVPAGQCGSWGLSGQHAQGPQLVQTEGAGTCRPETWRDSILSILVGGGAGGGEGLA